MRPKMMMMNRDGWRKDEDNCVVGFFNNANYGLRGKGRKTTDIGLWLCEEILCRVLCLCVKINKGN